MWCAIHLPCFAIDLASRGHATRDPLAVTLRHGAQVHVYACNDAAARAGITPGMALAAAQALLPQLRLVARDAAAENQALAHLADWAGQYSSLVSLVPPDGLVVEIGRSLALFGDPDALCRRIQQALTELGFIATVTRAPTPLAATWFARAGISPAATPSWQECLHALPLAILLDETHAPYDALRKMGLRTLGDLIRLPRAELRRRVGPALLQALDRALGHAPDPRTAFVAPAHFQQRIELLAPAYATEALLFVLRRLLLALEGFLRARQAGVSEVLVQLSHADQPATQQRLGFHQVGCALSMWLDVAREWLARLRLPEAVQAISVSATHLLPLRPQQHDALSLTVPSEHTALLLSRLQARLGEQAVHSVCSIAEHRPEYAWQRCAARLVVDASASGDRWTDGSDEGSPRPLWLLPQPEPLPLVAQRPWFDGTVYLAQGPERIESGWWDDHDVQRDYFVAHSARGERLWIFRTLQTPSQWFLHGFFG